MIVHGNQRWRERQSRFRRPDGQIRTSEYDVAPLDSDTQARQFVLQHHYSASYPAARFRYGMFRRGVLVGVAVFSVPCNNRTITRVFDCEPNDGVELGRFVLLDEVPGNGETFMLARCFEHLRKRGIRGVVSFSDPMPRQTVDGRLITPGHVGTIYQAANAVYLGRSDRSRLLLLPDGTALHRRVISKIRALDTGWQYGVRLLMQHGACASEEWLAQGELWTWTDDDRRRMWTEWLNVWLPRLTRPVQHPGNHKYGWVLRGKQKLVSLGAYPKKDHPACRVACGGTAT